MPIYINNKKVGIATIQVPTEDKYVFDTVAIMKSSSKDFIEGDTIKVNGYYIKGDLVDSTLRYRVMSYENWWNSLPEDMKVVSYTAGWFGYKYIKTQVDEYGNHTLLNGLVAKLITDGTVYAEQFGCKGDGVTNDITAIRHLFGMNKKNITIKFQKDKIYVVGTEKYNRMYYDDNLFNLVKDNNLYSRNEICVCNEYATQGGKAVGGYCCHIKPTLTNVENLVLDGNNCTIFIPDNEFCSNAPLSTPFSWLEMSNYINELEIKNFTIDCNGLNQKVKANGKPMSTTNHGIFYGGDGATEISSNSTMAGYLTSAGVSSNVFDAFPCRFTNVSIHDNIIKNTGSAVSTNDMGGDGILIIPPPIVENIKIYNNTFFNIGRWTFAIDLVNDKKDCKSVKFYNNTTDFDETNVVDGKYRGLGWIDFECTRRFTDLEVSNNTVRGCCGFAFNGGSDCIGENIIIKNNNLNFPALSYYSSYLYDLYFYNLNANNLVIESNTIINNMNNDNSRSLGYAINNLTIKNNRFYKCPIIHTSLSGNILIDGNLRIDQNNEQMKSNCLVVQFQKHSQQKSFDNNYAQIIFTNNLGGFGGSFMQLIQFPLNYSFLICGNKLARFNASFYNSNKPRLDLDYISADYNSLRFSNIHKPIEIDDLNNFRSYGYIVEEGQILAKSYAREIIVTKNGYIPITKGAFGLASADINSSANAIDDLNLFFYTDDNVYLPLNKGKLGSEDITHIEGVAKSGEVDLKYVCPKANYITKFYEIYNQADLSVGKIAEFNASDYQNGSTSFIDSIGNYTMNFDSGGRETFNNIVDNEFVTNSSGDTLSGTCFTLFEGVDFGDEFTLVIKGSSLKNMGIGTVATTSKPSDCLFYIVNKNIYILNYSIDISSITDKTMFVFVFSKGKEPIVYCNTTRLSTSTNIIPLDINYTTNFKLVLGRTPYKDFGYYKYAENKIKNIIVYNRRISYTEVEALYNQ